MLNYPLQNCASVGREVYLFCRQQDGSLTQQKNTTFFPYFFQENPKGIYLTIDGKKVNKIFCKTPYEVAQKRDDNSYESDILYFKRFVIDNVGQIIKSPTKILFIDIEIKTTKGLPSYLNPEQLISCISIYNNHNKDVKTFWIKDYMIGEIEDAEDKLLEDFVKYIKEEKADIITGWNFTSFDYPYLCARIKKLWSLDFAEVISPINSVRYGRKEDEFPYPNGISVMDYLELFKKIYRTELKYSLDYIAQKYLNCEANKKVDFTQINDEIKEKNILDVKKLADLENRLKIFDFFDEIRRLTCCLWEDVTWNSKSLDMMLLKEAKKMGLILPSKKYGEEFETNEFEGAYRRCEVGLFNNIFKLDLSSAYPASIINFCLDIGNITTENKGLKIDITDRETNEYKYSVYFKQNQNALLPTIARRLIAQKDLLKSKLKTLNPETPEYEDLQIKYSGIKSVVNSLFGVTALKIFRLYDVRIASSITSIIRDLLHYVENKLIEKGMKVIYLDTDSFFVDSKEDPKDFCNQLIKQWAKDKYNKDDIDISFDSEGIFSSLFVLALCHYKGRLQTKSGLKIEEKGIESKRKDASKYIQEFQTKIIDKILDGEKEEIINNLIKEEIETFKTKSLIDISFPFKINKEKEYKSIPVGQRACEYSKELNPKLEFVSGDTYYWCYVKSLGQSDRTSSRMLKNKETGQKELKTSTKRIEKNVLAFEEGNIEHIKEVDYEMMIKRNILDKIEKIYEALNWDFSIFVPKKEKKPRKKKEQTITEFAKEEVANNAEEKALEILDNKESPQSYYEE